jgi:hypothetical protein
MGSWAQTCSDAVRPINSVMRSRMWVIWCLLYLTGKPKTHIYSTNNRTRSLKWVLNGIRNLGLKPQISSDVQKSVVFLAFYSFKTLWVSQVGMHVIKHYINCRFCLAANEVAYFNVVLHQLGTRGRVVGWGSMLQAGRSRVRFPMRSLDFFIWPNPSSRTMALGSTQPLTEMSTRNLPGW